MNQERLPRISTSLAGPALARGTWVDEAPPDPERVGDGPVCTVCRAPDGGKEHRARCLDALALHGSGAAW